MDKEEVIESIYIRNQGKPTTIIPVKDVEFFKAEDKYINVNFGGRVLLSSGTIKSLIKKLPDNFMQIAKGTVINKNFVVGYSTYNGRGRRVVHVHFKNNELVKATERYNKVIIDTFPVVNHHKSLLS